MPNITNVIYLKWYVTTYYITKFNKAFIEKTIFLYLFVWNLNPYCAQYSFNNLENMHYLIMLAY